MMNIKRFRKMLLLLLLCCSSLTFAEVVTFPGGVSAEDRRWDYVTDLLQLVLDKTKTGAEEAQVVRLPVMSEARRIVELNENRLDVAFGFASIKLEASGVAMIPIPLQKGLLGWRLLMVTPASAPRFANVRDLHSLQPLRAGFSKTFADYPIMEVNGLNMSPGSDYKGLFHMLRLDRSDYISRGIGEIDAEVSAMDGGNPGSLLIQPDLVIHYPGDTVFIVTPSKPALRLRIEKGLRLAMEDGSMDNLLNKYFASILKKSELQKRTIIELQNPFLPSSMNVKDKSLWWRPPMDSRTQK
jgi:hypothetical protein